MTREELKLSIELEIVSSVLQGRGAADNILALFDRFEQEKWKHCTYPPTGPRRPILWINLEWTDKTPIIVPSPHALHYVDAQNFRWQEMPAPPKEVPNG